MDDPAGGCDEKSPADPGADYRESPWRPSQAALFWRQSRMMSSLTWMIIVTAGIVLFAGSAVAVIVMCWRAPLRNDLDDGDIGRWLFAARRPSNGPLEQSLTERPRKNDSGGAQWGPIKAVASDTVFRFHI
jgi:hypothetical protein